MKKIFVLFFILAFYFVGNEVNAQRTRVPKTSDSLTICSIGYFNTLSGSSRDYGYDQDVKNGYPKDLSSGALFFILISEEETKGNVGFIGVKYDDINAKLISEMEKNYPYAFKTFPNEYRPKKKEFFLEQGCRFRLLIHSTFQEYTITNDKKPGWEQKEFKQLFAIEILDLKTGKVYGTDKWYYHYNYIKKFLKHIK